MKNSIKMLSITGTNVSKDDRLILEYDELIRVIDFFKQEDMKIVYTSGTFDLFHVGHARYLEQAKTFGDILIVAVDSDELTRKTKGERRPVVPFDERSETLIHNRSVNIVTIINDLKEVDDLIERIKPDVMVLSTSTGKTAEDSAIFIEKMKKKFQTSCSRIEILEPQATTSTSAKIRSLVSDGGHDLFTAIQKTFNEWFTKGGHL